MAVGTRRTRPSQVPPQKSLWHHLRPAATKTRPITAKKPDDVIMLILADTQRGTYTFHFEGSEESAGHGHAERDGENENERQCQRKGAHLHHPQDSQADQLDQSEEMHP